MSTEKTTDLQPMLIGDQWITSDTDALDSVNPANGSINCRITTASAAHVDAAVSAAREAASAKSWRDMLPHVRAQILGRISDGIRAHSDELARLQMIENGKVLSECKAQVASAASTYRYYAAVCETLGSEIPPSRGDYLSMTAYEPYGIVAAITPWNSPMTMEAQKIAPALAAGNAVLLKPSEVTPSVGLAVARIALEAGLPPAS